MPNLPFAKTQDFLLDGTTHDIQLDENGYALRTNGVERIAQAHEIELSTAQGENPLDTGFGLPYFEQILGKNKSLPVIEALIKKTLLARPDTLQITEMSTTLDAAARRLLVTYRAVTTDGVVTTSTEIF